jgi:hypothetical protein
MKKTKSENETNGMMEIFWGKPDISSGKTRNRRRCEPVTSGATGINEIMYGLYSRDLAQGEIYCGC